MDLALHLDELGPSHLDRQLDDGASLSSGSARPPGIPFDANGAFGGLDRQLGSQGDDELFAQLESAPLGGVSPFFGVPKERVDAPEILKAIGCVVLDADATQGSTSDHFGRDGHFRDVLVERVLQQLENDERLGLVGQFAGQALFVDYECRFAHQSPLCLGRRPKAGFSDERH